MSQSPEGSGLVRSCGILVVVMLSACASAPPPPAQAPAAAPAAAAPAAAAVSPPVATIDGKPLPASALDAHQKASGLPRDEALADLIDLTLLREAAAAQGVPLAAGEPTAEVRAAAELAVARKLALDVPPAADVLIVDHAWVKDAPKKAETARQKKQLESLRALVVGGQKLPEAFKTLPGVNGAAWHIGDHEEYPYGVVPPEAHDLSPGAVSPVVAGDGGLHLFQIHARKTTPPPADAVHALVRDTLRSGKGIEIVETATK
jgi:hypothetical protein